MNGFTIVSFQTDKLSREEIKDNERIFRRYLDKNWIFFRSCIGQSRQWGREKSIIVFNHLTDLEKRFVFDIGKQEAIITDRELLFANEDSVKVKSINSTLVAGSFYETVQCNGYGDCTIIPFNKYYTEVLQVHLENE